MFTVCCLNVQPEHRLHLPQCISIVTCQGKGISPAAMLSMCKWKWCSAFSCSLLATKVHQLIPVCLHFSDFKVQKSGFDMFTKLFTADVCSAPQHLQMEFSFKVTVAWEGRSRILQSKTFTFYWFDATAPTSCCSCSVHVLEHLSVRTDVFNYEFKQNQAQITHHWWQPPRYFVDCLGTKPQTRHWHPYQGKLVSDINVFHLPRLRTVEYLYNLMIVLAFCFVSISRTWSMNGDVWDGVSGWGGVYLCVFKDRQHYLSVL